MPKIRATAARRDVAFRAGTNDKADRAPGDDVGETLSFRNAPRLWSAGEALCHAGNMAERTRHDVTISTNRTRPREIAGLAMGSIDDAAKGYLWQKRKSPLEGRLSGAEQKSRETLETDAISQGTKSLSRYWLPG